MRLSTFGPDENLRHTFMTITELVYRHALAILWSAGHQPSRSQRISLQSDAWKVPAPKHYPLETQGLMDAACALLRLHGYDPDPTKPVEQALPEIQQLITSTPMAGHAVRLTGKWFIKGPGTIFTLSSTDTPGRLKIGCGSHYMTEDGLVSLSAGGPSSARGLRTECLVATGEIMRVQFWRFHLSPEANGGVYFTRPAAIWEWDGDEAAFSNLSNELAA